MTNIAAKIKKALATIETGGVLSANEWRDRIYINHTWFTNKGTRKASYGYFLIENNKAIAFIPEEKGYPYTARTKYTVQELCESLLKNEGGFENVES